MSSVVKFCSCRACKAGKKCSRSQTRTKKTLRSFKRQSKQAIKNGAEPPTSISIPYTD